MPMSAGYGDRLLVAPTWEPVTVDEMSSHSRLLGADADVAAMQRAITSAREYVETLTKRCIPAAQWMLLLDQFPGRQVDDARPPTWRYGIVRLPRPPLRSVDLVRYIDPAQGTPPFAYTTLATTEYMVDADREPGRLAPAPYKVWPTTNPLAFSAVEITFSAGYATAELVPERLKQAIRMVAAHLYEHREEATEVALSRIPLGARAFAMAAAPWEYA